MQSPPLVMDDGLAVFLLMSQPLLLITHWWWLNQLLCSAMDWLEVPCVRVANSVARWLQRRGLVTTPDYGWIVSMCSLVALGYLATYCLALAAGASRNTAAFVCTLPSMLWHMFGARKYRSEASLAFWIFPMKVCFHAAFIVAMFLLCVPSIRIKPDEEWVIQVIFTFGPLGQYAMDALMPQLVWTKIPSPEPARTGRRS